MGLREEGRKQRKPGSLQRTKEAKTETEESGEGKGVVEQGQSESKRVCRADRERVGGTEGQRPT